MGKTKIVRHIVNLFPIRDGKRLPRTSHELEVSEGTSPAEVEGCAELMQRMIEAANNGNDIEVGKVLGKLEELPATVRGKRTAKRNRRINGKRSAEADVRRQVRKKLVEKEIDRQRKAGERLNYEKAKEFAAKCEGCSLDTIKNSVPNRWTNRKRQ